MLKQLSLWLALSAVLSGLATAADYAEFTTPGLAKAQITHSDIAPLITYYKEQDWLEVTELGRSVEQRPIYLIKIGDGERKVLAWSQMHGDEPTATAAIFDLLAVIEAQQKQQAATGEGGPAWLDDISLYLIPMLNPDGAERNSRFNALGIDVNRDALALQTPEGQLLMQAAKKIKPHYGFNLHDQNRYHGAGDNKKPATISLLAPAYNEAREINPSRHAAMQLVSAVKPLLDNALPEQLGRYNDEYSIRSFGDTFSGMGISTVLVESGGQYNDPFRQQARQINVQLYLSWLEMISTGRYRDFDLSGYNSIPMNNSGGMKDLIISNINLPQADGSGVLARVDLAFTAGGNGRGQAVLDEIGDASIYGGYHTLDASGMNYSPGKAYPLTGPLSLSAEKYLQLLADGYSHFSGEAGLLTNSSGLPVAINPRGVNKPWPQRRSTSTFLLSKDSAVQLAVVNGRLIRLADASLLDAFSGN
ncbi:Zinc carboxypeptidase [Arsukibacterium tuosuense]|uniref:Zinc carboxypeptidase n=1 Tax=Arsukibacterium tuosuense TaxID=1323745 RepID=A0A285JKH5_9GAMM|nr:M14 family zinc carboxypeptidase [Arsukibacterium tuosuense]SNY60799.1 Zinc carboxypeptidase [Arsukibacterium tuosuense]